MTGLPVPDVVTALRNSSLFGLLPERDITELAASTERRELPAGAVLVEEGSPPEAMYIVLTGELEVTRNAGGSEILLNVCGPGEFI
jgi:CRP-like cAMP-binding protein